MIIYKFTVVEYFWKLLKTHSSGNHITGIHTMRGPDVCDRSSFLKSGVIIFLCSKQFEGIGQ